MRLFVFSPGILGSGLRRKRAPHEDIWPPGLNGTFKSRTFQELTADLAFTEVIEKVCVMKIYASIFDLFGEAGVRALAGGAQQDALLRYPYDWRQGVQVEADRLATKLDEVTAAGDEIVLVAHSMGALLSRFLIEADRYKTRPFLQRVSRFVSINGPLLGAPIMLARALALEQTEFIKWSDQKQLLATPPFSGAYALMPAPGQNHFFNGAAPMNIYDPHFFQHFGLGSQNMADATEMWAQIDQGAREDSISYVLLSSLLDDKKTIERVVFKAGAWERVRDVGDGAVPPWSSQGLANAIKPAAIAGEHRGMIDTLEFRSLFDQHIARLPKVTAAPSVTLQPLKQHVRAGGIAEFSVVREGVTASEGVAAWTPVTERGTRAGPAQLPTTVGLPQQAAPVVGLRVPDRPGIYDVTFTIDGAKARARVGVRSDDEAPPQGLAAP